MIKGPTMQSDLLYIGRWSRVSWDHSFYKETPPYHGIRVSSLPLHKSQTLPFLRYVNSPYFLYFWVLGDSSIIALTFRGSLASTPLVPFDWFFYFVLQVHPLARVWMINLQTIFVHHQLVSSVGTSDRPYRCFKDKVLYGLDAINNRHKPRDWKPAQRIKEVVANPRCNSWMTYLVESWVGKIVGAVEW